MVDGTRPWQWLRGLTGGWGLETLAFAALLGCGGPDNLVVIHLENLPADTQSVEVSALLDSKPSTSPMRITSPLDRFFVQLPEDTRGHLALDIRALDSDGCAKGTSSAAFDLPAPASETTLSLLPKSPRQCGSLPPCAAGMVCPAGSLSQAVQALWAGSPQDLWAVGKAGLLMHYDGQKWNPAVLPPGATPDLYGVWGSSGSDVWAVGSVGQLLHYDGTAWSRSPGPVAQTLYGIWGTGPGDIYAAGASPTPTTPGTILHYDGSAWTAVVSAGLGTGSFESVWTDRTDSQLVYACGAAGLLVRYNGATWDAIPSPTSANLHAIWGTPDHTLFAVGDGGAILRIRYALETSWTQLADIPTTESLLAIRGDLASGILYAAGSSGVILRADPPYSTFTLQTTPTNLALQTLAPLRSGLTWFAGTAGFLAILDTRP